MAKEVITFHAGWDITKFMRGATDAKEPVKKLNQSVKKMADDSSKALASAGKKTAQKDSFLSPGWFATRARWFVQLRTFWVVWQQLSKAVAGAFDFEQEMQNVRAITQATTKGFEDLRQKALEIGRTTRFSASEVAKGMTVMAQAGMSGTEIVGSIENVANLATATLYDFEKTASTVVTIMRAWNMTSQDTQKITDVLATSINKTKLNMDALATGFNYLSGIAPQMNLNLEQTTALMGVLANRGLSASTASTSLRAILAALNAPTEKFKRTLHEVGLTYDDVNPATHELGTILETLNTAGFGAAQAFRAFRRRAAAGATVAIQAYAEFQRLSEGMNDIGRAAQMAQTQLWSVQGQWKQFEDNMIAAADSIQTKAAPSLILLIQLLKDLVNAQMDWIEPMADSLGKIARRIEKVTAFVMMGSKGYATAQLSHDFQDFNNEIKTAERNIVGLKSDLTALSRAMGEIKQSAEDALDPRAGGDPRDLMKRAIRQAHEKALIDERDLDAINAATTLQEKQVILLAAMEKSYESRARASFRDVQNERIVLEAYKQKRRELSLQVDAQEEIAGVLKLQADLEAQKVIEEDSWRAKSKWDSVRVTLKQLWGMFKGVGARMPGATQLPFKALSKLTQEESKEMEEELRSRIFKLRTIFIGMGEDVRELTQNMTKDQLLYVKALQITPDPLKVWGVYIKLKQQATSPQIRNSEKEAYELFREEVDSRKESISVWEKSIDQQIEEAKARKEMLGIDVDKLEIRKKELEATNYLGKNLEAIRQIELDINELKKKQKQEDLAIQVLRDAENEAKVKALKYALELNDAETANIIIKNKRLKIESALLVLKQKEAEEMARMEFYTNLEKERGMSAEKAVIAEGQLLALRKQNLLLQISAFDKPGVALTDKQLEAKYKLEQDLVGVQRDMALQKERELQATSSIARLRKELREDPLLFDTGQQFLNAPGGIFDTLIGSGRAAMTEALGDITSLWRAQREEAAGLKVELDGLNAEYQQALSEGNIQRARELELQMSNLRGRIDDLNDPLQNLGNTFREFAKVVIEELQKVIIKMLILRMLNFVFGGESNTTSQVQGFNIPTSDAHLFRTATGGILPGGTFRSFRRFANGGVTSGIGAAILGDNPSGKELVIPSENIEKDKVSGRVQDSKQPINIINVLTEEDVARAMAGTAGQRTIINTIGRDLGKRGPTYRAIKT